jgi:cation diffusion facilitator CzcD-associated flavoprotein CzcO
MKIAVIGAGCSGLVTLKYLLDSFPSDDVICFEKSHAIRGCWGNQRPDFISTSTKYTTQFSCFRKWSSDVSPEKNFSEFYRGAEFGDYLEKFAEHFNLRKNIQLGVELKHLAWKDDCWSLKLNKNGKEEALKFDAVFLCTGLVNQKVPFNSTSIPMTDNPEGIRDKTVIVVGGGESAADVANYLAKPEHNNKVYLSLRSGIRVSPRYHPIKGVPSDFLRNRLLLSFDKRIRNWVGEYFVTFRIRFNKLLEKWFPHAQANTNKDEEIQSVRRAWDLKLKERAKGNLFNVFHNKSDNFLDAVAEKRLEIIGPAIDDEWKTYFDFEKTSKIKLSPDVLVWSTGYRSHLKDFSNGAIQLKDFYHGCFHTDMNHLFLIGFARPIIGNIPSISEIQAQYTVGLLAKKYKLPNNLKEIQRRNWDSLCAEYGTINTENVYPVEQFPYSDILAREMDTMPTFANVKSIKTWLNIMLTPASTVHYLDEYFDKALIDKQKVHTPFILIAIMSLARIVDYPFRLLTHNKQ